jgi:hypothetical protein
MDPRLKRGLRVLTSILFRSPKITKAIDSDNRLGRFVRMGGADRILIWWLRAAETDFLSTFCSPFGIQSPFGWRRFTVSPLQMIQIKPFESTNRLDLLLKKLVSGVPKRCPKQ